MSYTTKNTNGRWMIYKGNETVSAISFGSSEKANNWIERHLIPDADNCIKVIDLQLQINDYIDKSDWTVGQYSNKQFN